MVHLLLHVDAGAAAAHGSHDAGAIASDHSGDAVAAEVDGSACTCDVVTLLPSTATTLLPARTLVLLPLMPTDVVQPPLLTTTCCRTRALVLCRTVLAVWELHTRGRVLAVADHM